ncbi:hypothetical protein [Carboxylicivirga marina]|uniref:hypothetical protein n=1 Tax=Carboxylicivirga marina TaxID=2800988 RepID=UPI0025999F29|nr:hypothetical protein [uncultured Carboxylicivirga sp.]
MFDLLEDPLERRNLIHSSNRKIQDILTKFQHELDAISDIDNNPTYQKGPSTAWDVDTCKHNASSRKKMRVSNRAD